MKINEEIELRVDKFADKGKCLSRFDGFVIFMEGVIPGERVRVKIHKVKKKYADAKLISIIEASPLRVEPQCMHFGTCGGCKWQHVVYESQLEAKRQTVSDAIVNIGGFKGIDVKDTIPSPSIYGYRTKMEFSFSDRNWLPEKEFVSGKVSDSGLALGLHAPCQFSSVMDVKECYLQKSPSSEIVNKIRETAISNGWEPWNCIQKHGYLKHLIIRIGERTGEVMVNLVTAGYNPDRMKILKQILQRHFPEITTFVNSIVPGNSQNASGAEVEVIYGAGFIYDRIGNYSFEIKPNAFFQPNTLQAEALYNLARVYAELKPSDILYDLYCGTGTIAIFLSSFVKKVIGVEVAKDAIEGAYRNASSNGANNCIFVCGDVMKILTKEIVKEYGNPDVIIVDPPRPGLHRKLVEDIAELKPRQLVYISCNPMTQMRDIAMLKDIYSIEEVQPVDMFPQTYHIESIIKLRLRGDLGDKCLQSE